MDRAIENELRELGIKLAGIEIALWAGMQAILASSPNAAFLLKQSLEAVLASLSGNPKNIQDVSAEAHRHIDRWTMAIDAHLTLPLDVLTKVTSETQGRLAVLRTAMMLLLHLQPNNQELLERFHADMDRLAKEIEDSKGNMNPDIARGIRRETQALTGGPEDISAN